jgi:FG-GAP-like repeat
VDLIVVFRHGTDGTDVSLDDGRRNLLGWMKFSTGFDSLPNSLAIADVNNDQQIDLIVGDFDNDSRLDIAVAAYSILRVLVLFGRGDVVFSSLMTFYMNTDSRAFAMVDGDFNNDTRPAIAMVSHDFNYVNIAPTFKNYSFRDQATFRSNDSVNLKYMVVADFNNGNRIDAVVTSYDNSRIIVFIGFGNGSFSRPNEYNIGTDSGPMAVVTGDFDNDGRADILAADAK